MIQPKEPMTEEQKVWFLYGYVYAQAEGLKKDGMFEDMTRKEVIEMLVHNVHAKDLVPR